MKLMVTLTFGGDLLFWDVVTKIVDIPADYSEAKISTIINALVNVTGQQHYEETHGIPTYARFTLTSVSVTKL